MEGVLVGRCLMEPSLVIWKGKGSKIPIGCERGASDGFFLGNLQLDPDLGIWKGFWFGKVEWDPAR